MRFSPIDKILEISPSTLNLIFFGVMIGGSALILGSLYLIYDAQVFGPKSSTKTDLMLVSITFSIIHVILTYTSLFVLKKMRRAKRQLQKEKPENVKVNKADEGLGIFNKILDIPTSTLNLIFVAVMIGGAIMILGSLYLIYDVQIFGAKLNTKTDLMFVSITFSIIHVILTYTASFALKKMRHARTLIQREKEEIAKIDKAKEEFSTMVAHELKTPLVPIHSYSKMLLSGRFGELTNLQKEKMNVIISGTESLLVLIQDMLDIHKVELGKMKLNPQFTDITQIVNDSIAVTQPLADRRGVTLQSTITKSIKLDVDKQRMEQVLTNLIKNAIDFVPKETGIIRVALQLQQHYVILSVSDNGCGIPKEELGNLFRKFYQVNTDRTRERGGTGLGLAICRSIIELHDGKIWAESEIDKGTTIKISLPLTTQKDEQVHINSEHELVRLN